jgi:hypothetical protein
MCHASKERNKTQNEIKGKINGRDRQKKNLCVVIILRYFTSMMRGDLLSPGLVVVGPWGWSFVLTNCLT